MSQQEPPPDLMPNTVPLPRTNAMRLLEVAKISYEVRIYTVDENDLSAERVAAELKLSPETVFKTLIAEGDKSGYLFAMLPAGTELDSKALAKISGNRRVELLPLKEVQRVTGYLRGAVTPLGAKKGFPVYVDETVMLWEKISMSCGLRGAQILISPEDLLRVTRATLADLVRLEAEQK